MGSRIRKNAGADKYPWPRRAATTSNQLLWSIAYRHAVFWSIVDGVEMGQTKSAVLVSGGLDSAILLAEMATSHSAVFPIYIQAGLPWEAAEMHHLRHFLTAVANPAIQALQTLGMPVIDLYGDHWSTTGQNVPDASTP